MSGCCGNSAPTHKMEILTQVLIVYLCKAQSSALYIHFESSKGSFVGSKSGFLELELIPQFNANRLYIPTGIYWTHVNKQTVEQLTLEYR